jgi:hypothetical protein
MSEREKYIRVCNVVSHLGMVDACIRKYPTTPYTGLHIPIATTPLANGEGRDPLCNGLNMRGEGDTRIPLIFLEVYLSSSC